jgi:hypothetical protein
VIRDLPTAGTYTIQLLASRSRSWRRRSFSTRLDKPSASNSSLRLGAGQPAKSLGDRGEPRRTRRTRIATSNASCGVTADAARWKSRDNRRAAAATFVAIRKLSGKETKGVAGCGSARLGKLAGSIASEFLPRVWMPTIVISIYPSSRGPGMDFPHTRGPRTSSSETSGQRMTRAALRFSEHPLPGHSFGNLLCRTRIGGARVRARRRNLMIRLGRRGRFSLRPARLQQRGRRSLASIPTTIAVTPASPALLPLPTSTRSTRRAAAYASSLGRGTARAAGPLITEHLAVEKLAGTVQPADQNAAERGEGSSRRPRRSKSRAPASRRGKRASGLVRCRARGGHYRSRHVVESAICEKLCGLRRRGGWGWSRTVRPALASSSLQSEPIAERAHDPADLRPRWQCASGMFGESSHGASGVRRRKMPTGATVAPVQRPPARNCSQ